jgi:hypothetical protein
MELENFIEYQRREYCRDIACPIQALLEAEAEASDRYETIRGICKSSCLHTTYEFHHWLIQKGYLVFRPQPGGEH